ncbi:uncharacterized protein LOC131029793 [Cryptomeria japonica]|uniref:uncharacterized protein LOC131029793 n=1 Tax=Cryptomeria japonica TaxID=3369 RepID=UPI0025AB9AA5|nr:uncharacterized protein LOC131029793 [Cryptomeria japonica]
MKIQKAWPNIKIRHGVRHSRQISKKYNSPTVWTPPQSGWIKANFDRAAQRGGGLYWVGVVFRAHSGSIIKLGAQCIKEGTNNEAEVYAAWLAIRRARKMGIKKLYLEGDSLIIIQAIKNGQIKAWHLQNFISLILEDLSHFEEVMVSHIKWEGNTDADKLSKWVLSFNQIEDSIFEVFDGVVWRQDGGYIHLPNKEAT